jgi:hypothetical protein
LPKSLAMAVAAASASVACTWARADEHIIEHPSVSEQFLGETVMVRAGYGSPFG